MTRVYGDMRRRPRRCGCGKIPFRSEAAALASADRRTAELDVPFLVYKCPGTAVWHHRTRGFHPRALKSRARIMAWHLSARRVITWDGLLRELDLEDRSRRQARSSAASILRVFAGLGLVRLDDPRPPYITAADNDGLLRVMMVGLQEYAESRGVDTTQRRPRREEPGS